MSLIFVRHGETALNVAQTVQPADTPLSSRGRLQAEHVAERLATADVVAIISSDLLRALQTAERIALRTGIAIERDALWQERNFGDWRGRRWQDLGLDPRTTGETPPGGESVASFQARVALAFGRLAQRDPVAPGAIVVVTHGLVIRALLEAHLVRPAGAGAGLTLGNTSVTIAARQAPYAVTVLDCLAHLDEASRHDQGSAAGL